jgi:putative PIN family toxin of toxin-antitoxin system
VRVVLDTNVLISALAFPGSKPDQILARVRRGELDLYLSPAILSELERVLRDKFRFGRQEVAARVRAIRRMAHMVHPVERIAVVSAKDDDNRILECAVAAQAEFLVTGDKAHLLPLKSYRGTRIITPDQLLETL